MPVKCMWTACQNLPSTHNYLQGNFALSDITGSNSSNYMEPQKALYNFFTFGVSLELPSSNCGKTAILGLNMDMFWQLYVLMGIIVHNNNSNKIFPFLRHHLISWFHFYFEGRIFNFRRLQLALPTSCTQPSSFECSPPASSKPPLCQLLLAVTWRQVSQKLHVCGVPFLSEVYSMSARLR